MIKVSAILLGAVESKRMGGDKLSLPYGKKTALEHCLEILLRPKVREVIVVLDGRTKGMRSPLRRRKTEVIMNPHYKMGMSTSIQEGVQTIDPRCHGILIAFGDHPFLKTRTIDTLIQAFAKGDKGIIVLSFRGRKGHPEDVWVVHVKSEGVVKDIDTWEDYKKVKSLE